jgi:hypothetical protein
MFGPYHHQPDPPSYGNVYGPDGKPIKPPPAEPGSDGTDYGRVHEGVDQWGNSIPPKGKGKKKQQQSRRKRKKVARRKKPKPVRIRPGAGASSAGKSTQAYPTASQSTGGAVPVRELDPLAQVGLSGMLLDLINHGQVTPVSVGHSFQAWQREQDRITNRTWRRPGGLQKAAGL